MLTINKLSIALYVSLGIVAYEIHEKLSSLIVPM